MNSQLTYSPSSLRYLAAFVFATVFVCANEEAQAAFVFYQNGASGGGTQNTYIPSNAISGTMTDAVPRFNPLLGVLIQADFEWAGEVTGSWTSIGNPVGTSTSNISGPADVGGQPMGILAPGYTAIYTTSGPSSDYDAQYVNATFTSGPFFNSLTGAGTVLMSWSYSGSTSLDTPAVGPGFTWGGSVHVLYTYEPVPEPSAWVLASLAAIGFATIARERRKRG